MKINNLKGFTNSVLKHIGLWFCIALYGSVYSQSFILKATLVELDSFTRIPFAVVSLKGKLEANISDERGYFEMVCNLNDTLVISHVGFKKSFLPIRKLTDSTHQAIKIYIPRKSNDLVPVTISGKRLSKEKKEEYTRHLERVRPNFSSPISAIYENFSRKGKERTKMDAIYQELLLRDQLEQRLPPRKLFLITNDRSVKLDDLLILCPVSSYFVTYSSEYDFFYHFSRCWDEYKIQRKKSGP